MHTVQISEITIATTRQRREFNPDKLLELQDSIERLGLMHPIVVRENPDDGATFILVAGERRLKAITEIWALGGTLSHGGLVVREGYIPVVTMGELAPLDAYEAELAENTCRSDLTWQERAQAIAALHALRVARVPEHTVADTSEEVTGRRDGWYQDTTRQQIILAKNLDNPIIKGAANAKEAFKLLKRADEANNFAARALAIGSTFGKHSHRAVRGNCLDYLEALEPAQFDVICTDPPYGMDADSFGDGAGRLSGITHEYKDDQDGFRELLSRFAPLITRSAKPEAALYLCCDIDQFFWLRDLFRTAGWYVFRTPLINVKPGSGRVPLPDNGPRRQYETILYAFRGDRKVNSIQSDVITTVGDEQLGHGAQKPVELFRNLLARSCRPGDMVLDPFAGSGTIFPAAHELKVIATGIEMEAQYYGMCVKRIEELN